MTARLRWICYAFLSFGLAVALYSAGLRVTADAQNKRVLVLVDWRELNELPEKDPPKTTSGWFENHLISERVTHVQPWELLKAIPDASLAYGEETVGDLLEEGILSQADVTTTGSTFEVSDSQYQSDVIKGAGRHGYITEIHNGKLLLQIPQVGSDSVSGQPVCWRNDVIGMARARKIPLVLRPGGTEVMSETGMQETLAFCKDQPVVLFQGTQVLGFPFSVKKVSSQLKEQKQQFGWVEFDDQDGGAQLANQMAPAVARVHSITSDEMEKYDIERAVARYQLAVKERGIRVLFLRPFTKPGLNALHTDEAFRERIYGVNQMYFGAVNRMLKDNGFSIGGPKYFADPPAWLKPARQLAITLAATAAALLLLTVLVPLLATRWVYGLLGLGLLAGLASIAIHSVFSLVLLATGIVFPALGFWLAMDVYQRGTAGKPADSILRIGWALLGLCVATLCSAGGGLLIHGGMWDARALLHIDQYRGVTIALAVPVLLVAAYCWQSESLQEAWSPMRRELDSFWQRFTTLWFAPIRYGDVAVILVAVGAIGIVLLRSGNEGPVGVIGAEGSLRSLLEHLLVVRPRTKELLGHPMLILFLLSIPWRTRLSLLFALAGIVGQVSVLNTFEHLHTPLLITLQRVGIGLLIGLVAGGVLALVAVVLARFVRKPGEFVRASERPTSEAS